MRELKIKFEKTNVFNYLIKSIVLHFDETFQKYFSLHPAYEEDVLKANSAWLMFQEQQKHIDELQARVDAATNVYEKYRNGCCDIYDVFDEVEQALKGGEK